MATLYLVATPIGNLEDISIRAIKMLLESKIIACEDTRRTGMLIKLLSDKYGANIEGGVEKKQYVSIRDFNEASQVDEILKILNDNHDIVLVSDAGTPLISDPGFKLVREARKSNHKVVSIPGPFAGVSALISSGLPTDKFKFWGFLNKKWELETDVTHIIYESPVRAHQTAKAIKEKYANATIVIAQELTKIYENVSEYSENMKMKGEVTLIVRIPSQS